MARLTNRLGLESRGRPKGVLGVKHQFDSTEYWVLGTECLPTIRTSGVRTLEPSAEGAPSTQYSVLSTQYLPSLVEPPGSGERVDQCVDLVDRVVDVEARAQRRGDI